MRLHTLEITAFGPFAETANVDFDELGADGLFLLHGQTGAGKTTVLDAISYALYGTVPGARREAKRLRSDHAGVDTVPTVSLEATIGGRRVRLTRSPEFARPKRDGSGMRTRPAKARLTWLDGDGQHLSRISDVGDEVNRLLGMSADQFFQVVLLPQGDFARFLRTDNDDRELLLERLFDTERFGTAEEWLADRRRAGAAALAAHHDEIGRLIAQVNVTAEVDGPPPTTEPEEQYVWATDLLATVRGELVATHEAVEHSRGAADVATAELDDARRVAELRRRRAVAREQLADLETSLAERVACAAEAARAHRAVPAAAAVTEATDAQHRADNAADIAKLCADRLAAIDGGRAVVDALGAFVNPAAGVDPTAGTHLDDEIRAWTVELGRLGDLVEVADTADALAAEHEQCCADVEQTDAGIEAARTARTAMPAQIDAAEAELRTARECAAALPARTAERNRAKDVAAAAVELAGLRSELASAQGNFERARVAHSDAREHELDLRERRLSGMAAELAAGLIDGEPCQVCGATEHPAPAAPTDSTVTDAQEQAAVQAERRAAERRDEAGAVVSGLRIRIEACVARGGDGDAGELAARLEAAGAALAQAKKGGREADRLATQLNELCCREAELARELHQLERRAGVLRERRQTLAARIAELGERLRAAAGTDETVRHRHARIDALVTAASELRRARAEAHAAANAAHELERRAQTLLREAGFADASEVRAAQRATEWIERTEASIAAAGDRRAHAVAVLAEPDIVALDDTLGIDVAAVAARASDAARAHTLAVSEHAAAQRRARQLEQLVTQFWTAVEKFTPLRKQQDELAAVADLVAGRGENTRRMSLRSYVLAARLEEVALAGSARLRRMSGGRYEFVHTDAAGPRGKRGGLGLDVRDDYTGEVRPAKSLSGGETFLASLALALGLSDTVAEQSGGRVLDTMFIDEGFGTLDSETLDAVMGVLDELRAGGRVVGIVSHVDEMRQRIPSRLHVIRGRAGSRLAATAG
ncbi:SMC family ATPase [Aldersonia sp. NBC_00410]|uniref:AAA family ATPase n=1 Tax=Aldersonia sp. NBC_00410 TaxID=2975954 RepID=UPI00224F35DD|nr:SMC family ATPase [Aldersonia sp. NBC_00410]MCX5043852.1 SMC family ATPase [Aldersonia sp. NBC_00410]